MRRYKPIAIGDFTGEYQKKSSASPWSLCKAFFIAKWHKFKYAVFILIFFACVIVFFRWVFPQFIRPQLEVFFEIKEVHVQAKLHFANENQVVDIIEAHTKDRPLYAVDQETFQTDLLDIPWIETVYLKRVWPGEIQIQLQETVPIAIWNDEYIVSNQGDIFLPDTMEPHGELPSLSGQSHEVELVMDMYRQTSQLFRRAQLPLMKVSYEKSLVWHLEIFQGHKDKPLTLVIDSEDTLDRLRRFALNFASILKMEKIPKRVDLRYPTGMAVSWYSEESSN